MTFSEKLPEQCGSHSHPSVHSYRWFQTKKYKQTLGIPWDLHTIQKSCLLEACKVPFFSCLVHGILVLYIRVWVKVKFFL